jgi:iron complex transport system ATP-binding protein
MGDRSTPAPIVARLDGVAAGYRTTRGERRVLDGADLELRAGELVALLGANGSGKTTLVRVLAGTLVPTAGTVELFGRPLADWARGDLARSVTVLPQTLELPGGFRVAEIVAMGRIPHARSWFATSSDDAAAVSRALADADLLELADRPVGELSGGERQRVLVAMALAQEPRLLLLDEPTLHLDVAHQLALVELLDRLRRARGVAVLAVLHDMNLAAAFADRVVLVHRGRILPAGRDGSRIDPGLARAAFGVPVEEARTADGGSSSRPGAACPPRTDSGNE